MNDIRCQELLSLYQIIDILYLLVLLQVYPNEWSEEVRKSFSNIHNVITYFQVPESMYCMDKTNTVYIILYLHVLHVI